MGPKIKDVLRGWLKLVRERESEREKKMGGERGESEPVALLWYMILVAIVKAEGFCTSFCLFSNQLPKGKRWSLVPLPCLVICQ